jgi:hypothetical protein
MLLFLQRCSHLLKPFHSRANRRFHSTAMAITNTTERLASLRRLMKDRAIDMYSACPVAAPNPHRIVTRDAANRSSRPLRGRTSVRVCRRMRRPTRYAPNSREPRAARPSPARPPPDPPLQGPCSQRPLAFLTGFTGSAGTAVVTPDKAILATDGRYFAQAEKQLDANWELLKQGMADVPYWKDWYSRPGDE